MIPKNLQLWEIATLGNRNFGNLKKNIDYPYCYTNVDLPGRTSQLLFGPLTAMIKVVSVLLSHSLKVPDR
jgi:hypothetical protein